jgi:hypothetical protein
MKPREDYFIRWLIICMLSLGLEEFHNSKNINKKGFNKIFVKV